MCMWYKWILYTSANAYIYLKQLYMCSCVYARPAPARRQRAHNTYAAMWRERSSAPCVCPLFDMGGCQGARARASARARLTGSGAVASGGAPAMTNNAPSTVDAKQQTCGFLRALSVAVGDADGLDCLSGLRCVAVVAVAAVS